MTTKATKALYQAWLPIGLLLIVGTLHLGFGMPLARLWAGTNLPMLINALWHFAAAYLFMFFAGPVIAINTTERPVPQLAAEAMQFLGGMNAAVSAFAVLTIGYGLQPIKAVLLFFVFANLSQFVFDVKLQRTGRTTPSFYQITIGDALVALMNVVYCLR